MVVLSVAVTTKSGKPVLSRQFRPLPKSRIDGLLTSFPKLIPVGSQHTTVETPDVRFVYQPFDELYVMLITNKGSNILQDISTLSLVVRLITSLTPSMSEPAVLANSFELLCAFDEVVSLGYKENASLQQIRNVLEGESHEEKIQDIIARNKEAEAKEELKRRAKQLEMQRREQQRMNQGTSTRGLQASPYSSSNPATGGSTGGYAQIPRQETYPIERESRSRSPANPAKPTFKGTGMKLGKKGKQSDFLAAVEDLPVPVRVPDVHAGQTLSEPAQPFQTDDGHNPAIHDVYIKIRETVNAQINREGDLEAFDLKGDMDLRINNPVYAKVSVVLGDLLPQFKGASSMLQFQQHPNIKKFSASSDQKIIALKDSGKSFPIGQSLGVLRWKFMSKDDSNIPLTLTCWRTENSDGSVTANIEYDLVSTSLNLQDVTVRVPLEHTADNISLSSGDWLTDDSTLSWTIPSINAQQPAGNLEFTCKATGPDGFFPIHVGFRSEGSICGLEVAKVIEAQHDGQVPAYIDVESIAGAYCVV